MSRRWPDGPRGSDLPSVWQSVGIVALAWLVAASVAWSQASALIVEIPRKRIVLLPSVPDDWSVCDGADGACVSVAALRQATAMREQPR